MEHLPDAAVVASAGRSLVGLPCLDFLPGGLLELVDVLRVAGLCDLALIGLAALSFFFVLSGLACLAAFPALEGLRAVVAPEGSSSST